MSDTKIDLVEVVKELYRIRARNRAKADVRLPYHAGYVDGITEALLLLDPNLGEVRAEDRYGRIQD